MQIAAAIVAFYFWRGRRQKKRTWLFRAFLLRGASPLVVQDNAQQGVVYVEPAIVIDESQLLEFIHKKVDAGPRGADHFRQRLLRHFGKDELRLFMIAVARQQ